MNTRMSKAVQQIVTEVEAAVKALALQAEQIKDVAGAERLEQEVRSAGQRLVGGILQQLLQANLDEQPASSKCPKCGGWWHNKGRRRRGLVSSVGAITLSAPYRYREDCGHGQHTLDSLAGESVNRPMRQLLCMLGVAMASFEKAACASQQLLGVRISDDTISRICQAQGRQVGQNPAAPPAVAENTDWVGSCDGTMVHTRELGWKELKAYRFECDAGVHARAFLEPIEPFAPRMRQAALAMRIGRAGRSFFVSDAADWIRCSVEVQLPMAQWIVDIWHAYQHIHNAARKIYGEGSSQGSTWAETWCPELRLGGARGVRNRLRRVCYKDADRQKALEELLGYLSRHLDHMDYPTYIQNGYPISSGPMESFCKQLGSRLKGRGCRWKKDNVTPMATLVSLWSGQKEWTEYWAVK